ncbi:hypothetical protein [Peteryoungia ipomoeae]|uniref:Uncharacterized protein n=1 Tax=Peteryoungia ipomoeae TaxID=1210932 RepID=A0A4S8NZA6_9HYPH|nr:hypothetical protein [Peteryoungia ipomoeae]THV23060.1 hypothetical protein FAA97_10585 [Peteryoungia ipomoeae]
MSEKDFSGMDKKRGSSPINAGMDQPDPVSPTAGRIAEEVDVASFVKELLVSDRLIMDYLKKAEADERS